MKSMIFFVAALFAAPVYAQTPYEYLDRGRMVLEQVLQDHGDWNVIETGGQLVAQCQSCVKQTVVLFTIDDLSGRASGVSGRLAFVQDQRRAYCQALVSKGQGRCVAAKNGEFTSVIFDRDGDVFVVETQLIDGRYLVHGQFRGPEDTEGLRLIRSGLRVVARSLTSHW